MYNHGLTCGFLHNVTTHSLMLNFLFRYIYIIISINLSKSMIVVKCKTVIYNFQKIKIK